MHWTDIVITTQKSRVTNIAERINGRLNKLQIEYLQKLDQIRPSSPEAMRSFKVASGLGSLPIAGLESAQRFTGLSPSQRNASPEIRETHREDLDEEAKGDDQANTIQPTSKFDDENNTVDKTGTVDNETVRSRSTNSPKLDKDEVLIQFGPDTMIDLLS